MVTCNINIDVNILITNQLTLTQWFILYCVYNNEETLLFQYVNKCGSIPTSNFVELVNKNLLTCSNLEVVTFNNLKITKQGIDIIQPNNTILIEFDKCFEELKQTYPSKIKTLNGGVRRLHGDMDKCRKLYKKVIYIDNNVNLQLHNKIILAIKQYVNEHQKSNRLDYLQLLATFLFQKTYEQYLNDDLNNNEERTIVDAI